MSAAEMLSHQVEIVYDIEGALNPPPFCVGTIISSYLVLTVASCLAGKNESLIKIRANGKNQAHQIRTIDDVYSYAALDSDPSPFDVAVIRLNSDLELENLHVFKIRYDQNQVPVHEDFSGVCHEPGIGEVSTLAPSECSEILGEEEEKNFICTEPDENSEESFQLPHVGSSLICSDFLYGLLSINSSNSGKRVYTSVAQYSHWIRFLLNEDETGGNYEKGRSSEDLAATSFGGAEVDQNTSPVPYQLSLRFKGQHICGGVILDKRTALSAAHCFDPKYLKVEFLNLSSFVVVAGEQNLHKIESTEQIFQIEKLVQHPEYKHFITGNDIAVFHINGEFNFNERVHNIWISSPTTATPNFQDVNGTATGWGISETNGQPSPVLLSVDLEFKGYSSCKKKWGFLTNLMVCGYNYLSNTCSGDSGGPLVIKNYLDGPHRNKDLLIGISSFGPKECEAQNMPNGFTNVTHFYNWIEKVRSTSSCASAQFQCFNGDCIDKALKCDKKFDCADGSDEKICESQSRVTGMDLSHQVSLFDDSGVEVPCVGTILSSDLILTVASCLHGNVENGWTIKTNGATPRQNSTEIEEEQIRRILRVFNHPDFKQKRSKNNLAILVLDKDLNLNVNGTAKNMSISPTLNSSDGSTFNNFSGFSCGDDSFLSPLEIAHPLKCSHSPYKSDKLCLLPVNPTASSCAHPHPGSSLFCSDEKHEKFLCGIYANSSLGKSGKLYTNITQHLKWIESASADAKAEKSRNAEEMGSQENENYDEIADKFGLVPGKVNAKSPIPYQLSIQYQATPSSGHLEHICGAVILDKNTAITAATCFDKPRNLTRFFVLAGKTRLNDWGEAYKIRSVTIHPNYTDFRNGNDIAILHVDRMHFYQDVQGVWLPPFSTENLSNMTAMISGWGQVSDEKVASKILKMGKVSILPPKECLDRLDRMIGVNVREGVVCASDEFTRTCAGDSGGPLVIQNYRLGKWAGNLLVGITSFGPATCSLHKATGVFTDVSHFYDWIQENRFAKVCEGVADMLPCMTNNRKCYHKDWECDDHWDCLDGTDEMNCPGKPFTGSPNGDPLMKLFATLNLPHSVMTNESFDLQVNVHNNLGHDVNVSVTLFNKYNHFGFGANQQTGSTNETRFIRADRIEGGVAHFVITPLVIGDIPIEVRVVTKCRTAADLLIGNLTVNPEGVKQTRTQIFISRKPKKVDANLTREKRFEVKFPEKLVQGTTSLQLTVTRDAIGKMMSNLGHFANLPATNGEQNMMRLAANVLALDYLNARNSASKNISRQAKKNLQSSYIHQLRYRNKDGSFSIRKYESGSTWLTTQVLRWFVAAQNHAKIDDKVIKGAINFIQRKQQKDGSFVETGPLYHPRMGDSNDPKGVALTAHITLALIKANEQLKNNLNLTTAIEKGMSFISQESVYKLDDNYITNLVTATLMAGNHPQKTRFFEKMGKRAKSTTTKDGIKVKFWDRINQRERASGPLSIEMTSYALLAHLWIKDKKDSSMLRVYKWILSRQNPQGGLKSTQDTILGLTALTEFALMTKGNFRDKNELQLNIRASSNYSALNDTKFSVTVARWNWMVLQKFSIPVSTKVVNLEATGSGSALIQLTESWYVPRATGVSPHFNITANMTNPDPDDLNEAELEVCVSSVDPSGFNRSSVASIELPSGYAFYPADYEDDSWFVLEAPENAERFELAEGGSKLDVYFSSIPNHPPTCISFPAARGIQVANAKRASVLVYETADPDVHGMVSYFPARRINVCQLCQVANCDQEDCKNSK